MVAGGEAVRGGQLTIRLDTVVGDGRIRIRRRGRRQRIPPGVVLLKDEGNFVLQLEVLPDANPSIDDQPRFNAHVAELVDVDVAEFRASPAVLGRP